MSKKFKVNDKFSPLQFNQTDFGNIYHAIPREYKEPESIEDLALTLRSHHERGVPVTVRNAGHSTNGQTLTDGVQISLAKLRKTSFDRDRLEVSVEAGVSWHEVIQILNMPEYCTPIFPNNPNQQIRVTGNAAVGGAGIYSSKYGGLWNLIKRLKVVTMTGEIINCSREENPDIFSYSLGGFGRIAVIVELTLPVHVGKPKVLGLSLFYHNWAELCAYTEKAMTENLFDGVITVGPMNHVSFLNKFGVNPNALILFKEVEESELGLKEFIHNTKENYHPHLALYFHNAHRAEPLDFSFQEHTFNKKEIVYWYPKTLHGNQLNMCHPWSDHCIEKNSYPDFANQVVQIINKHGMAKYLLKDSLFAGKFDIEVIGSYVVRKVDTDTIDHYPLTLDLPQVNDYYYGLVVQPTVPYEEVDRALAMHKEITKLCYDMGGRKYLYGVHDLTREQVEKHFTLEVLDKWQTLKDKLDPKHLLNIGVIEHLDD